MAASSTLLRPSRPLSWVDSYFLNQSLGGQAASEVTDLRATHASVPLSSGGEHHSHYIVAWMNAALATLGPTDLYPEPAEPHRLVTRQHIVAPAGPAQRAGCVPGAAAIPSCVQSVSGHGLEILPTGDDPSNFSLTVAYEPLENGAYLLGELTKFVHVSPQRFEQIAVGHGAGPAGIVVTVRGVSGEVVELYAVDPQGRVCYNSTRLSSQGRGTVVL